MVFYAQNAFGLLELAGLIALITVDTLRDEAIATYVLTAIALPFLVVFARDRTAQWALIPAYALLNIATMVTLIVFDLLDGFAIPAYIMFSVAIPFLVVFLINRSQRWALIPGGILAFLGFGFFIGTDLGKYVIPAVLVVAGAWLLYQSFVKKE